MSHIVVSTSTLKALVQRLVDAEIRRSWMRGQPAEDAERKLKEARKAFASYLKPSRENKP